MEFRSAIKTVRYFMHCNQWKILRSSPVSLGYSSHGRIPTSENMHNGRYLSSRSNFSPRHHGLSVLSYGTEGISLSWTVHQLPQAKVKVKPVTVATCVGSVRWAGHSKWANIRHIKAAKDSEKAKLISEYSRKIRAFIRETGQTDPKTSSQLARLISEAKSKNVPNANIDRLLSQMSSLKNTAPIMYEAKGPGGSVMLIEALTSKMTQTRAELQSIVKKCGFSFFDAGSLARIVFEEKGLVQVSCPEKTEPELDSYVDMAIEAGAEDVTLEEDEEGVKFLQFVCEPGEVHVVKKELEARQLPVMSAEVVYESVSTVPMDSASLDLIAKAMDKLDEHPDVLKVYINVVEAS